MSQFWVGVFVAVLVAFVYALGYRGGKRLGILEGELRAAKRQRALIVEEQDEYKRLAQAFNTLPKDREP